MTRQQRFAIVGAGQSGLPLALSLLERGAHVTLVSNRSADEIRHGKVMSSQCMFGTALAIERRFGLDLWSRDCPPVEGIGLTVPHPAQPGERLIDWAAPLDEPVQAVDQRVKMPPWMELSVSRGSRPPTAEGGGDMLAHPPSTHRLTIVSAGKGANARLFDRDDPRSPSAAPPGALALT